MSVDIVTAPPTNHPTLLQRVFGTEPKTVVHETSTTTIVNDPGVGIDWKTALRNGGIGAAIGGALGGVSLLTKAALPFIGKIGSVAGLARLAGTAGVLGAATAAVPFLIEASRNSPKAKAAIIGGSIGAAAGAVLPFLPVWLGAAAGAGIGLVVHNARQHRDDYPVSPYPGYVASPGWVPYGSNGQGMVPNGMTQVVPSFGAGYPNAGYGAGYPTAGYGYPTAGYPANGYGYPTGYGMALPMQAAGAAGQAGSAQAMSPQQQLLMQQQVAAQQAAAAGSQSRAAMPGAVAMPATTGVAPSVAPAVASPPAAGAVARTPKFPGAKTWVDKSGNIRQVGTGKVLKAATGGSGSAGAVGSVPTGAAAPGIVPSTSAPGIVPTRTTVLPSSSTALPALPTGGLTGIDLSSITNPYGVATAR
jgi:hypothetical protein